MDPTAKMGSASIHWDSAARVLTVSDNGTGMTQRVIETNLLRVGSSRYQESEFEKEFPGFTAISRFGIGVLSTFMIADTVDIATCHPDDPEGRLLSLRSVHGRYLIRVVEKNSDAAIRSIVPHGTVFRLKLRADVPDPDVLAMARKWIVVPACRVEVTIDHSLPIRVGFDSLAEALEKIVEETPSLSRWRSQAKVVEAHTEGASLAYVLQWSEYFQDWSFVSRPPSDRLRLSRLKEPDSPPALGICVEGVRVEFDTPGFNRAGILALANATGADAPKTNVARSGLETTPQRDSLLRKIYSLYCDHVKHEMEELHNQRGFSLTWAGQEAKFLLNPLRRLPEVTEPRALADAIQNIPFLIIDRDGLRLAVSPAELKREPYFWTIDCAFIRYAEMILREIKGSASLGTLATGLGLEFSLPAGSILSEFRFDDDLESLAIEGRRVSEIVVHREHRRVDLKWIEGERSFWVNPMEVVHFAAREILRGRREIYLSRSPVSVQGAGDVGGVETFGRLFALRNGPWSELVLEWLRKYETERSDENAAVFVYLATITQELFEIGKPAVLGKLLDSKRNPYYMWPQSDMSESAIAAVRSEAEEAIRTSSFTVFNPSAWVRKDKEDSF